MFFLAKEIERVLRLAYPCKNSNRITWIANTCSLVGTGEDLGIIKNRVTNLTAEANLTFQTVNVVCS